MLTDLVVAFMTGFSSTFHDMAPYLLLGFLVAGALHVLIPKEMVTRHLGGRGMLPVLKAALVGVPLPLCSCGVIPVAASLRQNGSSRGAVMSFLLSTPQTGVDSILVTYAMLGPLFAVVRPVVALITGLAGGYFMDVFDDGTPHVAPAPVEKESCAGTAAKGSCCHAKKTHGRLWTALHYGLVTLPKDITRSMLFGMVLAGAIAAFVPPSFLAGRLGNPFIEMIVMMLVGIPLYVCATGSVPIAAALILKGISPGAALVFMITGPATNAAAIATMWRVLGPRGISVYLWTVALTSLAAGTALNLLVVHWQLPESAIIPCHTDSPGILTLAASVIMAAVMVYAMFARWRDAAKHA